MSADTNADVSTTAESLVEPLPSVPAALAHIGTETALVIADYHAGIEIGLRYERGVELDSNAEDRRHRLLNLLTGHPVDRLIILGDAGHRIGNPDDKETQELTSVFEAVLNHAPITVVRGNHDAGIESVATAVETDSAQTGNTIDVTEASGINFGDIGFVHGHSWPDETVLDCDILCVGHEHPQLRVADHVGGSQQTRAWLRGPLDWTPFQNKLEIKTTFESPDDTQTISQDPPDVIVFPAFNERSGGTKVNTNEGFLSPFLPAAFQKNHTDAYLLDGTRLGPYQSV
ncbi:metallophosphoesterase [Haloquadratum walsbyi]|uniref:Putative ICC-like phosphoesterase n=1 Tax=Haloquadratum walsbyi J07HQW2 TaxID=1238425 RepID=U1PLI5_9EURY|nr:metallophosphoesterase [Haloquadratum walsbyi]ERG94562.1 MAG: putative ICC-like phosphoesterase [Haloquadratum walsbyi J07HQW2]